MMAMIPVPLLGRLENKHWLKSSIILEIIYLQILLKIIQRIVETDICIRYTFKMLILYFLSLCHFPEEKILNQMSSICREPGLLNMKNCVRRIIEYKSVTDFSHIILGYNVPIKPDI